jgi:aryl carrier-like protein
MRDPLSRTDTCVRALRAIEDLSTRLRAAERRHAGGALDDLTQRITAIVQAQIDGGDTHIDPARPLMEYGLDSAQMMAIKNRLQDLCGRDLPPMLLFDHPTIDALAAALTQRYGSGASAHGHDADAVAFELSLGQQSLWMSQQLEGTRPTYVLRCVVTVDREIDPVALERALATLMRRHDILNSRYARQSGRCVMRIDCDAPAPFAVTRVDGWTADDVRRWSIEQWRAPIDLERGPVLRCHLLQNSVGGRAATVLHLVIHHIAADFWSIKLLLGELGAAYAAWSSGIPPVLAPVVASYVEHARRERARIEQHQDVWARHWDQALAGPLPTLRLPRPRGRARGEGREFERAIAAGTSAAVARYARSANTTPFVVMLTAFALLLSIEADQGDVIVGVTTAGRHSRDVEGTLGYFVNPVPVRFVRAAGDGFDAFFARNRGRVLAALAHQETPFAWLVDRYRPERHATLTPIFQALFTWLQFDDLASTSEALPMRRLPLGAHAPAGVTHDVVLNVERLGRRHACLWGYDSACYEGAEIEAMSAKYARLLGRAVGAEVS